MPRYAAFLRGVSPMNARMADLRRAFEAAGFTEVSTVLSSGNVVFSARRASEAALEERAEAAMQERLGSAFLTIVRPIDALQELLAADPYRRFRLPAEAKRVVTFLRAAPPSRLRFPITSRGSHILGIDGREAFCAYLPSPEGAEFMVLIQKTFGKEQTTRTWETVTKVNRRGS